MNIPRKINVKLKELRDADVSYVSLVDRSASRIPFRVTKADKESNMGIDLSSLKQVTKRDKAAKSDAPTVAAIVVEGTSPAYLDKVRVALSANGFDVGTVVKNDDGTVMFAQEADPMKDSHIVRISERMIAVMKGFDAPSEVLSESSNFSDKVAVSGYFPGIAVAVKGLEGAVAKAVKSDAGPAKVAEAISQFNTYVETMVASVPASVFKADTALKAATSDQLPTSAPSGVTQDAWDGMSDDDKAAWQEDSVTKGDLTAIEALFNNLPTGDQFANATIAGTPWASMSTVDKITWLLQSYTKANSAGAQNGDGKGGQIADQALSVSKSAKAKKGEDGAAGDTDGDDGNDSTALLGKPDGVSDEDWAGMSASDKIKANASAQKADMTAAVAAAMGPVLAGMKALTEKMESQQAVIDAVAQKSEAALKAVKGAVIAPAATGDNFGNGDAVKAKKGDADPRSGTFDTAFLKRSR